jgi:hypothetical protein
MTTASDAHAVIRTLLESSVPNDGSEFGGGPIVLRWFGDNDGPLPPVEQPFAFIIFDASRSSVIERGGGAGHLRHRNPAIADVFVFTEIRSGLKRATDIAEQVAAIYRSVNQGGVVVEAVTVYPGGPGSQMQVAGLSAEVGNYMWSGCSIEFRYDLIG